MESKKKFSPNLEGDFDACSWCTTGGNIINSNDPNNTKHVRASDRHW